MVSSIVQKIRETIESWRQIMHRVRRPYPDEFNSTLRIVILMILAIGAIGFTINMIALLGFGFGG